MNDELNLINQRYMDNSVGMYPFINHKRITILKKGFHWKKRADYRGISMIYDKKQERHKVLLIGYFHVPKNYIVVPEGLELTPGKEKLIEAKLNEGYELVTKLSLKPYEFSEDTEEYAVAKAVNENYKANRL